MIRVLHIVSSLEKAGGVQNVIYNYHMHMDKSQVQFDFVTHGDKVGELESYFESYGGKIFHVVPKRVDWKKNIKQLYAVIRDGHYDIVHDHLNSRAIVSLAFAKRFGVKGRIVHAHTTRQEHGKAKLIKKLSIWGLRHVATDFFACGEGAMSYLLGAKRGGLRTQLIHNAISPEVYVYSEQTRNKMRKQLGVEDAFVIGHVGRFDPVKNHLWMVDMFAKLKQREPKSKLVFVGDGGLMQATMDKVKSLGLDGEVIFLGSRQDVPALLQAMDVMILPSDDEGLAVVAIEAQAANLPFICSTGVPREADLTGETKFLPLDSLDLWCDEILKCQGAQRQDCSALIARKGYDIKIEAERLAKEYRTIVKNFEE